MRVSTGISLAVQSLRRKFWGLTSLVALGCVCSATCGAQNTVSIASSVTISKSGLVFNRITNTFNTVVTITNSQSTILDAPVLLAVTNIQPSTVTLANSAGLDSASNPYVAVSVPANGLNPAASVANILLEFSNPARGAFSFTLVPETVEVQPPPLPDGIVSPVIDSQPPAAAVVGEAMQYQPIVSSSEPSSLEFSLSGAPAGMSVSKTTGLVEWTPRPDQTGDASITLEVTDASGQTSQFFTVSVFGVRLLTSALIQASSGGTIKVDDASSGVNGLTLSIPANALSTDTTISVSELTAPPTFGGLPRFVLKGFQFEPEGVVLSSPATVSLPYLTSDFGSTAGVPLEEFLALYFLQTSTGKPQYVPGYSINSTTHTLTAPIAHFSNWAMTNAFELCAPSADVTQCVSKPTLTGPYWAFPTILVHGFQLSQSIPAGRGAFGQLSPLLAQQGIHAWRFDWDTYYLPFEISAGALALSMQTVEKTEHTSYINLVAHSFGGIVARSYLQGAATLPYQHDVNRTLTLGTPNQGIGGDLSDLFATTCAISASITKWPYTCYEAATGLPLLRYVRGAGDFLRQLNLVASPNYQALPVLASSALNVPYYLGIIGQRAPTCLIGNCGVEPDDGLITTQGNLLCDKAPNVCGGVSISEPINPTGTPLCHTNGLCGVSKSVAMADIESASHTLYPTICGFLNCFQLLGSWSGTGVYNDGTGPESNNVTATLDQSKGNNLIVSVVFTDDSDEPKTFNVTYTMTQTANSSTVNFTGNSPEGGSFTVNGVQTIDKTGFALVASGSDNEEFPSGGSGTVHISPDGLTISVTNISVYTDYPPPDKPDTSTVTGSLTIIPPLTPSGTVTIKGNAKVDDGDTVCFYLVKSPATSSVTGCGD